MDPLNPQGLTQAADPAAMGVPAGGEVSPEQKQALLDLIKKIEGNLSTIGVQDFAGKNKLEMTRRALLRQVFDKLQLAGVDLEDRESVAAFISNLKQESPELAQQFEEAMAVLLGEAESGAPQSQMPGMEDPSAMMQDPNMNMTSSNDQTVPKG